MTIDGDGLGFTCQVEDCPEAREVLLHLADDPWGSADFCLAHARQFAIQMPLVWACECPFCQRARGLF
jgi:hypothetical protein